MVVEISEIALHLRDWHVFMWQSVEVLNVFNNLTLKQIFWKTKTFLKKLGYCFLVKSIKIENASFPYKTVLSKANVKWWVQNGPTTINGVLSEATLSFWKFCFSLRTYCEDLIEYTNDRNVRIPTFCKCWNFLWWWFYPVNILNGIHMKKYSRWYKRETFLTL